MLKIIEFLVKSIVNHPDAVKIKESSSNGQLIYSITSHPDDIKIIIGKKGRTIKALREIMGIKALQAKKKVIIQIEDKVKGQTG